MRWKRCGRSAVTRMILRDLVTDEVFSPQLQFDEDVIAPTSSLLASQGSFSVKQMILIIWVNI